MADETDVAWNAALDEIARHSGAFAAVNALLARCAKAEAVMVALIARLDAGGRPADVVADMATLLDETREIASRAEPGAADLVLIYQRDRGYYRTNAQGYGYLDHAGLFSREEAERLRRGDEETIRIVEPEEVAHRARVERAGLLERVERYDRIIALAEARALAQRRTEGPSPCSS